MFQTKLLISIAIALIAFGDTCFQKWKDRPLVKPSHDLTTTTPTIYLEDFLSNLNRKALGIPRQTLDEIVINERCGVAGLAPSLDPSELNIIMDSRQARNGSLANRRLRFRRIISGERANSNSWPWVVGLYLREHGESFFRCAGTLIDSRYVLTSAHCVTDLPVNHLVVAVGSSVLAGGRFYSVAGVKIHTGYANQDDVTRLNDIALLKLNKSVGVSAVVNTVCMPPSSDHTVVYDKNVVVAGWGSTDGVASPASMSKSLIQTILTVFSETSICGNDADTHKYCAYKRASKNSNICWHDLGAPLMYYDHNRWFVYGVASSFGLDAATNECTPSTPSYYTMVPAYLNWITFTIEEFMEEDGFDFKNFNTTNSPPKATIFNLTRGRKY